jgi:hypothetical protein
VIQNRLIKKAFSGTPVGQARRRVEQGPCPDPIHLPSILFFDSLILDNHPRNNHVGVIVLRSRSPIGFRARVFSLEVFPTVRGRFALAGA